MEYGYCEFLLHQIAFYKDGIRPCCSFSIKGDTTPFVNNYDGNIEGIKQYLQKREKFINIFKSGKKPVCYYNCTTYIPSVFGDDNNETLFQLNNIIISNYTKCSCNCIYCEQSAFGQNQEYKKWLNSRECYDVKPVLLYLRENNYIRKNCCFLICGGECSEYPKGELEWLIYFAKLCEGKLLILSSGIRYSQAIEKALKTSDTILKISVDSGTKSTYEKIKRVKAYDITWSNIKRYINAVRTTQNCNSNIELKYIVIPGINDNIKEVNAFLNKCQEVNCTTIVLDVEHQWIQENKNNPDKHKTLKEIFNYFFRFMYSSSTPEIHMSFEGVEEDWLWSLVEEKYNYKKVKNEI